MHRKQIRVSDCGFGARIGQKFLGSARRQVRMVDQQVQHDMARHALLPCEVIANRAVPPRNLLQIIGAEGRPDNRVAGGHGRRRGSQANRRRQIFHRDRLGQHRCPGQTVGVAGKIVAADKNRAHGRKLLGQHFVQTQTVHRRHDHVGDQDIRAAPRPRFLQSFAPDRGNAHLAGPDPLKQCPPSFKDLGLVIDEKNLHHGATSSPAAPASGNSLSSGGNNSCRSTGSARVSCSCPRW